MITVRNASCGYDGRPVIRDVSFDLNIGEAVCVLGANGAGKTTVFKTLLGLLPLLGGEIFIDGEPIDSLHYRRLAKLVAYVPQTKALSNHQVVEDVVMMGRAQYIKMFASPSDRDHEAVEDALAYLKISSLKGSLYSDLSGGEQQLVLIARALVQGASYILLDEPASNLDLANQSLLMQTVNRLKSQNVGVLMISHVPAHAFSCCENTLFFFRDGSNEYGNTREIISSTNLKKAYGVDVNVLNGVGPSGEILQTCYIM